jgi:hypothetical protein
MRVFSYPAEQYSRIVTPDRKSFIGILYRGKLQKFNEVFVRDSK